MIGARSTSAPLPAPTSTVADAVGAATAPAANVEMVTFAVPLTAGFTMASESLVRSDG